MVIVVMDCAIGGSNNSDSRSGSASRKQERSRKRSFITVAVVESGTHRDEQARGAMTRVILRLLRAFSYGLRDPSAAALMCMRRNCSHSLLWYRSETRSVAVGAAGD